MQTYLKTRPVWIQLLFFLGMTLSIVMVVSLIGGQILSAMTGLSLENMADPSSLEVGDPRTKTFIRGGLLIQFLGLFIIPSFLFAYYTDPYPKTYLGLKGPAKSSFWVLGIAIMLLAIPMVELTGFLNRQIPLGEELTNWVNAKEEQAAQSLRTLLQENTVANLILNGLFIALFAGIGEELFFRGVLQRLFIRATRSPWAGIIIAAFLFSFLHLQFLGFVPRFLLGIVLGALYWYSGSLWLAIVAHFIYNAFFIVLAYFQPEMVQNTEATLMDRSYLAVTGLLSTALVVVLVWLMKKNSTTNYKEVYAGEELPPSGNNFTL